MKGKAATPPTGANGDGAQHPSTALEGFLIAFRTFGAISGDGPTADWSDAIKPGREPAAHDEQTGTVVFPVQTVGPNAKGRERRRLFAEGRSRRTPSDTRREPAGRARPRERRDGRRRAVSRSATRSGDSGDDGPSDEPPKRRRLCAFCGRDIDRATQAKYCSDKHADAHRKRRQRERDRQRDLRPRVPTTADEQRMRTFEYGEHEMLQLLATCRCNGHHILERDEELGDRCIKCGRQMPESSLGRVIHSLVPLDAVVA